MKMNVLKTNKVDQAFMCQIQGDKAEADANSMYNKRASRRKIGARGAGAEKGK